MPSAAAPPPGRRWPARIGRYLKTATLDADDHLDAAQRRVDARFGFDRPLHIAAYRAFHDGAAVELSGRVLAKPPLGGPRQDDRWWDNLLNAYRRFDSDSVPGIALRAQFRNASAQAVTDDEGYYRLRLAAALPAADVRWDNAGVSLADGSLLTPQPVLQIAPGARLGVISDIDDTILQSSIVDWKTAAELLFLHNARTRKPLLGVARLYQSLQSGAQRKAGHPIFYVSNSPWNLYDLLDDFFDLNGIPFGPVFLRRMGLHADEVMGAPGDHKLLRVRTLIRRLPQLRWVLLGDSGQMDAETYSEVAREFGDRILAIYIRDVDPGTASLRDGRVDAFIEKVAGTQVPMLRVADSRAIAEHLLGLGLIAPEALPQIAAEVRRDQQRPTPAQAATRAAVAAAGGDPAGRPGA